ncbi:MAG TPA: TIGR04255 family protein [Planctomycetota bacterium]|nr:TIGR04255 family protein [Planctomycetota bacterium]
MREKKLKHAPLVEAIMELRWGLRSSKEGIDPHYKVLVGRLYDRLAKGYPEHEPLPTASMPDEIVKQMVQHRFRRARQAWPLVQIGPGILTVNETREYDWEDFRTRAVEAVDKLFESHPEPADLRIESVILRYIDALEFDYTREDVLAFLKKEMKLSASLLKSLFSGTTITSVPRSFMWYSSFPCTRPAGELTLRFATGQRDGENALVWETIVQSKEQLPDMPGGFEDWITAAHQVTHDWFFKMIKGDLERRFRDE